MIDTLIIFAAGAALGAGVVLLIQGRRGPAYALLAAAAALLGIEIGRASKGSSSTQHDELEPPGLDGDTEPGLVTEIKRPVDHTKPEDQHATPSPAPTIEPGDADLSDAVDWLESRAGADDVPR